MDDESLASELLLQPLLLLVPAVLEPLLDAHDATEERTARIEGEESRSSASFLLIFDQPKFMADTSTHLIHTHSDHTQRGLSRSQLSLSLSL